MLYKIEPTCTTVGLVHESGGGRPSRRRPSKSKGRGWSAWEGVVGMWEGCAWRASGEGVRGARGRGRVPVREVGCVCARGRRRASSNKDLVDSGGAHAPVQSALSSSAPSPASNRTTSPGRRRAAPSRRPSAIGENSSECRRPEARRIPRGGRPGARGVLREARGVLRGARGVRRGARGVLRCRRWAGSDGWHFSETTHWRASHALVKIVSLD